MQDEGSQLAALLSAAKPGEQVIDLCAGAGGKTLALAAMMQGKGRLIATDHDKRQLAPIYERLSRAGVHNADVRTPKGPNDTLTDIHASRRSGADRRALHRHRHLAAQPRRQMADAPRRARGAAEGPGRGARSRRRAGQAGRADRLHHLFGTAAGKRRAGQGFRRAAIRNFRWCRRSRRRRVLWDKAEDFAAAALQSAEGWLMTPRRTGTDGFFVSVLRTSVILRRRTQSTINSSRLSSSMSDARHRRNPTPDSVMPAYSLNIGHRAVRYRARPPPPRARDPCRTIDGETCNPACTPPSGCADRRCRGRHNACRSRCGSSSRHLAPVGDGEGSCGFSCGSPCASELRSRPRSFAVEREERRG